MPDRNRFRFAPSPTGFLHVGGLRTALFNYFLAKKFKGDFILRIEDTDQKRFVDQAEQNLIKTLSWANIYFDEGPHIGGAYGPYRQSERISIYKDLYYDLIHNDYAYPCFYNSERIEEISLLKLSSEELTKQDLQFRNQNKQKMLQKMDESPYVVRLIIPDNKTLNYKDLVKGNITFNLNLIDDPIIIKSDGFPTYHFANVVDDHLMQLNYIIRGEEWLPSIPKHIILYQAFKWNIPQFGHLPLLLNSNKTKLSKRENDVSVENYIKQGYLSEAVVNFLSLLGWHEKGDKEIYSESELVQAFSLERINKSGAIFDIKKLDSFNQHYIRNKSIQELYDILQDILPETWDINTDMIALVLSHVTTLNDFVHELEFFFIQEFSFNEEYLPIINSPKSQFLLHDFYNITQLFKTIDEKQFQDVVDKMKNSSNYTIKDVWKTLRIALTGKMHGPHLGGIVTIYGIDVTRKKIKHACLEK